MSRYTVVYWGDRQVDNLRYVLIAVHFATIALAVFSSPAWLLGTVASMIAIAVESKQSWKFGSENELAVFAAARLESRRAGRIGA